MNCFTQWSKVNVRVHVFIVSITFLSKSPHVTLQQMPQNASYGVLLLS